MAGKARQATTDAGWSGTCYAWAADLHRALGLVCQVSLTPTTRTGVWKVVVRALEIVDGRPAGIRCQHGGEWPNSDRVELLPYVYKLQLELDARLAQEALRRQGG